jgi:hypothetical protein
MLLRFPFGALAAACSVLLAPLLASAQPAPAARAADPLDPRALVPPSVHRSALSGFRGTRETPLENWKEANDRVARIGGWRVYTREAQEPESTPVPRPSVLPQPPPASSPARETSTATPAARPAPAGSRHHGQH